jgi:hypothetical protein
MTCILRIAIIMDTSDGDDEYRLTSEHRDLEEYTPADVQRLTAKLIDDLLIREGMIEVGREELESKGHRL